MASLDSRKAITLLMQRENMYVQSPESGRTCFLFDGSKMRIWILLFLSGNFRETVLVDEIRFQGIAIFHLYVTQFGGLTAGISQFFRRRVYYHLQKIIHKWAI